MGVIFSYQIQKHQNWTLEILVLITPGEQKFMQQEVAERTHEWVLLIGWDPLLL